MGVTLQTPPDTDSPNPNFPKPAHPQTPALMATPSAQPGQAVQTRQGSRWPVRGRRTELLPLSWPRGRLVGFSRSLKRFWGANRGESEGSGWAPRPCPGWAPPSVPTGLRHPPLQLRVGEGVAEVCRESEGQL